jgi:tetratricopeptide (TPR) repeat protein
VGGVNPGVYLPIFGVLLVLVYAVRVWYSKRAKRWTASAAAVGLYQQGEFALAEKAFRSLVREGERSQGAEHAQTLANRHHLANCLTALGRAEEAVAEFRQVLAIRVRLLGVDHLDAISTRHHLATAWHAMGNREEAEKQFRKVLAARERLLGPESNEVLKTCYALALNLEDQSRDEEAMMFATRCEVGWRKMLGASHPATMRARRTRERMGRRGETEMREIAPGGTLGRRV